MNGTVFSRERAPWLGALALGAIGVALIARGTPQWWFGSALCAGAGVCLHRAVERPWAACIADLSRERNLWGDHVVVPLRALLDVVYVAILTWTATFMFRDLLWGVRPISHDHTVHFFKAWQLHEHFLSQGRLHGFSHRWFAGYPVNYLYPIGTDLFVDAVHTLGCGALSLERAYGVAFWLFHVLTGYAGYRLGRMLAGQHVGFLSGFLLLTDLSEFRFGGFAYTIEFGVWPQALSLVFALLAVVRIPAIYHDRALRPVGIFALWMGLAIITHPIELIFLGILLLAAVLAGLFSPYVRTARGTAQLLFAYALSIAVSAVWLLPFLQLGKLTTPMGVWWTTTYELGKGLVHLNAFPGTLGYVLAFGMVGCALLLRSGQFTPMFTAFVALLVPALCNSTFIDELHLSALVGSFSKVQWLRMATMVKPFWFAMASYGVFACLRRGHSAVTEHISAADARISGEHVRPRSLLREVVFAIVIAQLTLPFVVPAAQAFYTSNIAKTLHTQEERARDTDREKLLRWLQTELPAWSASDSFYRVGVSTGHNHDLLDIGAFIDRPIYKRGFTPAENFIYKVNTDDPAVLRAVNLRYMIAKRPLPAADFTRVARFGIYQVFEFKHWQPQPFVITAGAGDVRITRFDAHEIRLIAQPGAHGTLRLNVSNFPRWHAYRNDQPVRMWSSALPEAPVSTGFMTVELAPGEYRFVFELSALDQASWLITLLGTALAGLLVISGRLRSGFPRLSSAIVVVGESFEHLYVPRFRWLRRSFALVSMVGGLCFIIYCAERTPKLALEHLNGVVVRRVYVDFLEQLSSARVFVSNSNRAQRCPRIGDRFVCRGEDGNLDADKYVASAPVEIEEYRMARCIRARPEAHARLDIEFPQVPRGEAIVGYFGNDYEGRLLRLKRPVDFRIALDGQPVYEKATESDNKMHWFQVPVPKSNSPVTVRFSVSATDVYRRYFCFYAQMADLNQGEPTPREPQGELDDEEEHVPGVSEKQ